VELASLQNAIELNEPRLVSLMLANNETGVIQPVAEAAELVHRAEALLHCDAIQAFGRIEVEPARLGADLLTISAHKLGGPQGVGALVLREGLEPEALLRGGGQEGRRRAGTENVPAIAGFAAAVEASTDCDAVRRLRDRIEKRLPWITKVVGGEAERLPNTSCILTGGLKAETAVIGLDLAGIAVSSGAACSSGKVARSHVLLAMGYGGGSDAAIRVSLGWSSTTDDVEAFLAAYTRLLKDAGLL
jgi:cysteine desulfurase